MWKFERVNVCFQAENCNAEKLFESLHQLYQPLRHRVHSQGEKIVPPMCDFRAEFIAETLSLVTIDPHQAKPVRINAGEGPKIHYGVPVTAEKN